MSRILLLLDQKQNRRLLAEWLAADYEVAQQEEHLRDAFDLCIADTHALSRLREEIRRRKTAEQPLFLPILLVSYRHVGVETHHLWEYVDESITAPIRKAVLRARVEILMRARRLSQENADLLRQLEAELIRAAEVQVQLLPREVPPISGFELAGKCVPAREVGGDFFDWQETTPGVLTLTLGDAMGKGMPAALLMATVRAALRAVVRKHRPAAALELVRQALQNDFLRSSSFVTLFHSQLQIASKRLVYVDAGHTYACIRRRDGTVVKLNGHGPALGIPGKTPYAEHSHVFHAGEALVVYSDGLIDAQPSLKLEPAQIEQTLRHCDSAAAMMEQLLKLGKSGDSQPDDMTVLVLRCK